MCEEKEPQPAPEEERYEVVCVRFRPVGKNYSFDPNGLVFTMGESVIVETSQGQEFGTVSVTNKIVGKKEVVLPLKKVLRRADERDLKRNAENKELENRARKVFQEKNAQHKLDMALSDVECSFDRSKLIFYFTSEGRVDFREFVKDVASVFKTRIELRQIGVRDEAKQLGGLGICGRPLCCSSFLDDFQQVSIKMAKEQNLSLNPTKISGTCGRLMCCLRYENDVYVEASKRCPKVDSAVQTPQGRGVVVETNVLCGRCKVKLDSDPENVLVFQADQLKSLSRGKKSQNSPNESDSNGNDA
ncbi:MAG: stage 0 sporulation family protein [Clostridia bacterium]|nr:stage 0 sporulation family protein [Clostridia bacterium]